MLVTVEGVYEDGKIEIKDPPPGLKRARVLATFLPAESTIPEKRQMVFGQLAGPGMSTEEDFRIAEWWGEDEEQDAG